MTLEGQVLGTPAYMSPEQASGESHRVDGRTDVYSLGVILYRMLTGELPFRGNTRMLLHQVLHEEPRPPRSLNDRIPRALETICLKAMAKHPARRYATARALAEELRRFLKGEPIQARPVSAWERGWHWARRRPAVAALLAALVVVVTGSLLGLTGLWLRAVKAKEGEEAARGLAQKRYDEARLRWYISDMNLAQRAWDDAHVGRMLELLEGWRPRQADDKDLRAFEWYYLWHLCHSDLLTLKGHAREVYSVVFSPDGQRLASASNDQMVKVWETTFPSPEILQQRAAVRLRQEAAARQRQKAAQLNEASWTIVRKPGAAAAAYRQALLQAEEASRLAPDDGNILNTLGVALYRAGEYQKALDILRRSDQINSARYKGSIPQDLAFLGMAHYRLGQKEKVQAFLSRLREAMKKAPWDGDGEGQTFLREAEALLQGQPKK